MKVSLGKIIDSLSLKVSFLYSSPLLDCWLSSPSVLTVEFFHMPPGHTASLPGDTMLHLLCQLLSRNTHHCLWLTLTQLQSHMLPTLLHQNLSLHMQLLLRHMLLQLHTLMLSLLPLRTLQPLVEPFTLPHLKDMLFHKPA